LNGARPDMAEKIKIAFVIDTIETPAAGTEKQLLMLMDGLDRTRFSLSLITLRESDWIREHILPCPRENLSVTGLASISFLRGLRQYLTLIKRYEVDIVHSYFFNANVLVALGSRFYRPPLLLTTRRGFFNSEQEQPIRQFILRRIRSCFDGVLCNSSAVAAFTQEREGYSEADLHVIHNGIDIERFGAPDRDKGRQLLLSHGIRPDDRVVGCVANLRRVKNIDLQIRAARELCSRYDNLHFVVIGQGDQRPRLNRRIDELGLKSHFHLLGSLERPENVLANCDIGVLSSLSESLSNALIEYSVLGLPVVASEVGGNSEVILHGRSGFLFESDNLKDFVGRLGTLLDSQELCERIGHEGGRIARDKFSEAACLLKYEEYYERRLEWAQVAGQTTVEGSCQRKLS